ncbi:BnaA09g20390D [Brassica napus]|uniref:(rape) hypothetical protein n=1 Tax=Brassica napus TaxID=3708 RepID=A0A078FUJ6_BRANA|nr:unnamed protein product [Brassica napus]CDY16661.1 BnaA09g20390D [Brassica napus]
MHQRTHTEWRPIKDKPEGESRKDTTTLVPKTFEMEEERKRKLKGKAIATDTSLEKSRPLLSKVSWKTPKAHETSATENLKDVTGKAVAGDVLAEVSAAEDEEIIDDEAFERMVEQYTEPGMENDVNMNDEDDLLEEEMELDRQRMEREEKQRTATVSGSDGANLQKSKAAPESLGNRSLGSGEREEDERRKNFAASSQEKVTRQRFNGSTRVENDETGALTEKQMASTLKRKRSLGAQK